MLRFTTPRHFAPHNAESFAHDHPIGTVCGGVKMNALGQQRFRNFYVRAVRRDPRKKAGNTGRD